MNRTLTLAETTRIEELLSRLEPEPAPVCTVPGCLHLHTGTPAAAGLPTALAA